MAHKQYAEFTCDGPGCDESIKVDRGEPIDLEHLQRVAGMAPAEA